jgi:hypothetical protein
MKKRMGLAKGLWAEKVGPFDTVEDEEEDMHEKEKKRGV